MKLRAEKPTFWIVLGTVLLVSAVPASGRDKPAPVSPAGPAADYPVVLGAPFTVNGVTYTPADKLNFDQVGYAVIDPAAGTGVSIAHRTLPLPSYVEVTSLRTGKTILVRVERRGPMTGDAAITLSPNAAAQLGASDPRTPVRIRRVNPTEPERALLRTDQSAPARMDTPMSLVAVLMRKLDPSAPFAPAPLPPRAIPVAETAMVPGSKQPAVMPPMQKPVPAASRPPSAPLSALPVAPPAAANPGSVGLVVQVGAYSNRASAAAVAAKVGGALSPAGRLFRVRLGGFAGPAQASAALAKVKAAGYSDARIQRAD